MQIEYDTSSADESVMRWFCDRAAASAWDFLQAYSNNASSADLEFQMTSGGNMTADGSFQEVVRTTPSILKQQMVMVLRLEKQLY